jgi:predicted amidohydrolase
MIKVASVQSNPVMNGVDDNVDDMVHTIEALAGAGVQLAVFPELATTGSCSTVRPKPVRWRRKCRADGP